LSIDHGAHPVLVEAPRGEAREIFEDPLAVRMKDMGSVAVNENSVLIRLVICISGDMGASIDQQDTATRGGEALSANGAGKARSHDEDIIALAHRIRRARSGRRS